MDKFITPFVRNEDRNGIEAGTEFCGYRLSGGTTDIFAIHKNLQGVEPL